MQIKLVVVVYTSTLIYFFARIFSLFLTYTEEIKYDLFSFCEVIRLLCLVLVHQTVT